MQKKRRRVGSLLKKNKLKSMLKRTYLEPNRNSMQKPIGGGVYPQAIHTALEKHGNTQLPAFANA
jgi:hypothetical protein